MVKTVKLRAPITGGKFSFFLNQFWKIQFFRPFLLFKVNSPCGALRLVRSIVYWWNCETKKTPWIRFWPAERRVPCWRFVPVFQRWSDQQSLVRFLIIFFALPLLCNAVARVLFIWISRHSLIKRRNLRFTFKFWISRLFDLSNAHYKSTWASACNFYLF